MNPCQEAQVEYAEIQKLQGSFRSELDRAAKSGDFSKARKLRQELQEKIDSFRDKIHPYSTELRRKLAEKFDHIKYISAFHDGIAIMQDRSDRFYYIDKQGKLIHHGSLAVAKQFSDGLAFAKDHEPNGVYFIINKQGEALSQDGGFVHTFAGAQPFSEGLAAVRKKDSAKWYFINTQGQPAFEGEFNSVFSFHEGRAIVDDGEGFTFIDKKGRRITEKHFNGLYSFSDGLARVSETPTGNWYFINQKGEEAFPGQEYILADSFSEGFAAVKTSDNGDYYKFINTQGQDAFPGKIFGSALSFSEGLAAVIDPGGNYYYFINKRGEEAFPGRRFGGVFSISANRETLSFSNGRARVPAGGGGYKFINKQGQFISTDKFSGAKKFADGVAEVTKNGETYYIDRKGRRIFSEEPAK